MKTIDVDGTDCKVLHSFGPERCIVNYDGLVVFADFVGDGWILSGEPASAMEKPIYKALVGPDGTTVTATIPDLPAEDDLTGDQT